MVFSPGTLFFFIDIFTNGLQNCKNIFENNLSVCIFPEEKDPDDESVLLNFIQNVAFRLAEENQLPIVPNSFLDYKKYILILFSVVAPEN